MPGKHTHDYCRHGITTLFAGLEVSTGLATDGCYDPHQQGVPRLPQCRRLGLPPGPAALNLRQFRPPTSHPIVSGWLANNPRVTLYFTPRSIGYLNLVEIFFGLTTPTSRPRRHALTASETSTQPSPPTSTVGTTPTPSPGPRPPGTSSTTPDLTSRRRLHTLDTSTNCSRVSPKV